MATELPPYPPDVLEETQRGEWDGALDWFFHHRLQHDEDRRDELCRFCPKEEADETA